MKPEKLVHMANQIGKFFSTQVKVDAAEAVAEHLRKFWDPRMRAEIGAYLAEGGKGLDPFVRQAVEMITVPQKEMAQGRN
jgi:formate dehydrogenase subunit delta